MERRGDWSINSETTSNQSAEIPETQKVITKLETQVEEQKKLRLQEAKQVEAKAALIKEWVANKLRGLEEQNQQLREQNDRCNQQIELLRNHLEQLRHMKPGVRTSLSLDVDKEELTSLNNICNSKLWDKVLTVLISLAENEEFEQNDRRPKGGARTLDFIQSAIFNLREKNGSCVENILDYLCTRYDVNVESVMTRVMTALRRGVAIKVLEKEGNRYRLSKAMSFQELEDDKRKKGVGVESQIKFAMGPHLTDSMISNEFKNDDDVIMDAEMVDLEEYSNTKRRSDISRNSVEEPLYAELKKTENTEVMTSRLSEDLEEAIVNLNIIPDISMDGDVSGDDLTHDYAEIYTPSKERMPWKEVNCSVRSIESDDLPPKPPTPPLHRFPSWESRIYQIAAAGFNVASNHPLLSTAHHMNMTNSLPYDKTSHGTNMSPLHNSLPHNLAFKACHSPNLHHKINSSHQNNCSVNEIHSSECSNNNVIGASLVTTGDKSGGGGGGGTGPGTMGYCDINVPVYATVKGCRGSDIVRHSIFFFQRASQIRSIPFTGDSSDDSSDGEDCPNHSHASQGQPATRATSSSEDTSLSGGSNSSPLKTCSLLPSKTRGLYFLLKKKKDTSFESGTSDDYAIPPDAVSSTSASFESSIPSILVRSSYMDSPTKTKGIESLEKAGYLTKLGGKLKTWRKRWFVLKNGVLIYWKSQNDVNQNKKPAGEIFLDESCRITRAEGAATFEINNGRKTYYLTADSIAHMEEWLRILQNVQRRNATKLLLNKEEQKPTLQGWLVKVKNGHPRKCWCVLLGKMFLYFKSSSETNPVGQINMRDARVEEVDHVSDSDSEDRDGESNEYTIAIFPSHYGPTYLIFSNKLEKDSWLYHLTVVSGGGPNAGTQWEQLIQKLMETDGDPNNVLWRHPMLLYSKDCITSPLTTLSTETLQSEAIKLFKSCQLFMSAALDQAGIDYHVVLAQNALQLCLDQPELQSELISCLIKQTSRPIQQKQGVQVKGTIKLKTPRPSSRRCYYLLSIPVDTRSEKPPTTSVGHQLLQQYLLCATQSLFSCDSTNRDSSSSASSQTKGSPTSVQATCGDFSKGCPSIQVLTQGWQLLALACSLFLLKNNKLLWFLKLHLSRNADTKTECGKYARYCARALGRTLQNGGRQVKPSRMEVLSILLKNPYDHSLPHAIPVHMLNDTYQVVSFDGSTTIEEFLSTLAQEIGCRESSANGFTLFSDDPIEKNLEHFIPLDAKLCDVISKWETALREKGSGKFENSRLIQLVYKNRLYFKCSTRTETEKERLLLCYQTNQQIVLGRFPLTKELALELSALMTQIEYGEYSIERSQGRSGNLLHQAVNDFYPYRYRDGLSPQKMKELQDELMDKWKALKGRTIPDCVRIYLTCVRKWPFFGSSLFQAKLKTGDENQIGVLWVAVGEDAVTLLDLETMSPLVRHPYSEVVTFGGCQDDLMLVVNPHQKHLFSLSKPKILQLTLLIADYMNALGRLPGTPQMGSLSRRSFRRPGQQPDILKSTPDQQHGTSS
ncbi:conserved hypothetical protein [Pediculus humanus corporis]|uniref:Plekhh1 n=1 Tax=Pediculus humanus subsp. corporis TaxID=121224 RepID=E0W3L6_PEDHC|nr:uncharacterized protein Phum_PHUM606460 [Pediculus humanus corporis]EEB20222.1 conserved hypothetical protein [Pediculus humanus corporis]